MNKYLFILIAIFAVGGMLNAQDGRPNILLIAIDDLNDWVGAYDGHPQAKTPNIDQFADNAVVFRNASCPGPVCGPSRSALLSGYRPSTTGIYGNGNNMLLSPIVQNEPTLPEYFSKNGYLTISSGKIFHKHSSSEGTDHGQWAYDIWEQESGNNTIDPTTRYSRHEGIINGQVIEGAAMSGKGVDLVWGATIAPKEETKDYRTAKWFEQKLQEDYDKPFFMLAGMSKPHLPFAVPQEFYDQFGLDTLVVPEFKLDDLDDIVDADGKTKFSPDEDFLWIEQQGLHKEVVRAYLAASSYADACTGVILDALANSKYADNTIVMIWGDHGWHLGEKLKYRKASLWKEATQLPFIFYVPGMNERQACFQNVNLLDIYPTLIDLCGLPEKELDGTSFQPLLENVNMEWAPAITTKGEGNHSVMYKNWHYITYNDVVEELYNLENDPMEWINLANIDSDEIDSIKQQLRTFLPSINVPTLEYGEIFITKEERLRMLYGGMEHTITFPIIPLKTIGDEDFDPGASANSGLPVTYASSDTGVAKIVGNLIHIEGVGKCNITASQEGNEIYVAAESITRVLTVQEVQKTQQIIFFPEIPVKTLGDDDFNPGAYTSSGLPVTYSSSNEDVANVVDTLIHINGAGETLITAMQEGNELFYAAQEVSQTLAVQNNTSSFDLSNQILLYPVPANSAVSIEVPGEYDFSIYNDKGSKVLSKSDIEGRYLIDLEEIVSGVYYIKINTAQAYIVKKLIKY